MDHVPYFNKTPLELPMVDYKPKDLFEMMQITKEQKIELDKLPSIEKLTPNNFSQQKFASQFNDQSDSSDYSNNYE